MSFSGNFTHRKDNATLIIEGAGDNAGAYREEVNGQDFTVSIAALPPGTYTVTIGETESVATAVGQRVFSVWCGESTLVKDFDIFKAAGGARKPTTISGTVEHAEDAIRGPLKISFVASPASRIPAKFNTIDIRDSAGKSVYSLNASELPDSFSAADERVPEVKDAPIWRDAAKPQDARIKDLIRRMSLEEKVAQFKNAAPALPRLGLPAYDYWERSPAWRREQQYCNGLPRTHGGGFIVESGIVPSGRNDHRHRRPRQTQ